MDRIRYYLGVMILILVPLGLLYWLYNRSMDSTVLFLERRFKDRQILYEANKRALLAGYPDRVAMRREPGSPRFLLAAGTGATLARDIEATPGEFVVGDKA